MAMYRILHAHKYLHFFRRILQMEKANLQLHDYSISFCCGSTQSRHKCSILTTGIWYKAIYFVSCKAIQCIPLSRYPDFRFVPIHANTMYLTIIGKAISVAARAINTKAICEENTGRWFQH